MGGARFDRVLDRAKRDLAVERLAVIGNDRCGAPGPGRTIIWAFTRTGRSSTNAKDLLLIVLAAETALMLIASAAGYYCALNTIA